MLASLFSWWLARITELLPTALTNAAARSPDGIVVDATGDGSVTVALRRRGKLSPIGLGAAARQAGRRPVSVHPPTGSVLVKNHLVPTVPPRQINQLLRYELGRITPFAAEDLFWRWDGHTRPSNRTRTDVTLTMVPRKALAPALAALADVGLKADFVEIGPPERPCLLPVGDAAHRTSGTRLIRVLAYGCAALAVVAVLLPLGLQAAGSLHHQHRHSRAAARD